MVYDVCELHIQRVSTKRKHVLKENNAHMNVLEIGNFLRDKGLRRAVARIPAFYTQVTAYGPNACYSLPLYH